MSRLCYVCEGGDCTERGSGDIFEKLRVMVAELDPDEQRIRVRRYPCFGGCEHGVNITLFPDRVFLSLVTEADLADIVRYIEDGDHAAIERLQGKVEPDVEQIVWDMLDSPY